MGKSGVASNLLQSTARTCDNRTHHLLGFSFLSSANRLCSTGWIQELVVGERCVLKKKKKKRNPPENPEMKFHFSSLADLSLSPSLSTSSQIRGTEKSSRNCFTHPLVDPRYTTSAVVKGKWCAEAVPPRTKKDSQTASPEKTNPTSGEHEWLLYRHSLVSSVSVRASQSQSSSHNHIFDR